MDAIEPNWQSLIFFGMAWAIACIGFFFVSGSLPVSAAPAPVQSGMGPVLVGLNLLCIVILTAVALVLAILELRITSPIVLGGLIFLFAPFAVQDLPDRLRDSKLGLLLMFIVQAAAIGALYASGALLPLWAAAGA